jgi:membrane associated rhomboid family serine protease
MLQNNICPHIEWYSLAPILIAICTIVYIVEVSIGFTSNTFLEVSQTTYTQMGVNTANLVYHGQVYRLVVCLFLHVNLIHLVANMLALLLILATM